MVFKRLYLSLDDMDSVVGIAAVRKSEPSMCEVVLENIARGKTEVMSSRFLIENMGYKD